MTTIGMRILGMGLGLGLMLPAAGRAWEGEEGFQASAAPVQQEAERDAEAAYRAAREALNRRNFQEASSSCGCEASSVGAETPTPPNARSDRPSAR